MSRRGIAQIRLDNQVQAVAVILRSSPEEVVRRALDALVNTLDQGDRELARELLERTAGFEPITQSERTRLSDSVRQYVVENYFDPARRAGRSYVNIPTAEVHAKMGLRQRYTSVTSALGLTGFHRDQKVRLVASKFRLGAKVLTFEFDQ